MLFCAGIVMLGKQDNCQVAVSVTLACQAGSLPVAWQLYLPKVSADDELRRHKTGVPKEATFATQQAIALAQFERLLGQGAVRRRNRHGVKGESPSQ